MPSIFGQLKAAFLEKIAGNPSSTTSGRIHYDTTANKMKYHNGTIYEEVVGKAESQALTNKTLTGAIISNYEEFVESSTPSNPASGSRRFYVKSDGKFYQLDSTGTETPVGSGGGVGINFIDNPDFEVNTTGWATYADAAGTSPVDGTGGSPTVTLTRQVSTALIGTALGRITKDAANRQGEGASYAFSIDSAFQASALKVAFKYRVNSGTFVAGSSSDISVWIYDVTNAVLIPVDGNRLQGNSSTTNSFLGIFQSASNSTSYRLIFHVATTSAAAYTIDIDDVTVGPMDVAQATIITDKGYQSWTPTGSWSTNAIYTGKRKRIGDEEEFEVKIALGGTPDATALTVNLPVTIDTTKLVETAENQSIDISSSAFDASGSSAILRCEYNSSTSIKVRYADDATNFVQTRLNVDSTNPFTWASGDYIILKFKVPVLGYSSSAQISSASSEGRFVGAAYASDAGQSIANATSVIVDFEDKEFDTMGLVTVGASWKFTANSTMKVLASAQVHYDTATFTQGNNAQIAIYKNGSLTHRANTFIGFTGSQQVSVDISHEIVLNPGDYIDFRTEHGESSARSLRANASQVYCSITKVDSSSSILAQESVTASYAGTSTQSITSGSFTVVAFKNKIWDSHGLISGSDSTSFLITAPIPGEYEISGDIFFSSASWTAGTTLAANLQKNNSDYRYFAYRKVEATGTREQILQLQKVSVMLSANDTCRVRVFQNEGSARSLSSDNQEIFIQLKRIGNYIA